VPDMETVRTSYRRVLLHFERQFFLAHSRLEFDRQRVVDGRQAYRKIDIHDRTAI